MHDGDDDRDEEREVDGRAPLVVTISCPTCGGTGKRDTETQSGPAVPCPVCGGKGRVRPSRRTRRRDIHLPSGYRLARSRGGGGRGPLPPPTVRRSQRREETDHAPDPRPALREESLIPRREVDGQRIPEGTDEGDDEARIGQATPGEHGGIDEELPGVEADLSFRAGAGAGGEFVIEAPRPVAEPPGLGMGPGTVFIVTADPEALDLSVPQDPLLPGPLDYDVMGPPGMTLAPPDEPDIAEM